MQASSSPEANAFDTHEAGDYDPALYRPVADARQVANLHTITEADLAFYDREGYLSVAAAFTPQEVQAALDGLLHLIMGGNPEFKGILFEARARAILSTLGPEARQDAVRKLHYYVDFEPRLRAIACHPLLLAVVERILGERPVLFANQALIKPPSIGREKPWHQDKAYFNYEQGAKVVGVWVALDEATVENGCMQFLPGRHREGPIAHFKRRDWQICDNEVLGQGSVAAPLQPGGLVFFDGLIPHGTPHNLSGKRRRALQFHFVGETAGSISAKERMAVYGAEGKDVEC